MSDWTVGDLALCVYDGPCWEEPLSNSLRNVRRGNVYTVARLSVDPLYGRPTLILAGVIATDTRSRTYGAYRFRRILPDKHEPCEAEFVALLKRGKVNA